MGLLIENLAAFNVSLEAACAALPVWANTIKRRTALDILGRVTEKSPVDTGRFRSNWQVSLKRPVDGENPAAVAGPGHPEPLKAAPPLGAVPSDATIQAAGMVAVGKCQPGDAIWITNNVPYAARLEEGHSQQAPPGTIVALTLEEVAAGFQLLGGPGA